jgi:hypothetical protein
VEKIDQAQSCSMQRKTVGGTAEVGSQADEEAGGWCGEGEIDRGNSLWYLVEHQLQLCVPEERPEARIRIFCIQIE